MSAAQVDFYILADYTAHGRQQLACRLAEKAYNLGHRVYLHCAHTAQCEQLDDGLWTFRQNSFVPHSFYPLTTHSADSSDIAGISAVIPPVLIGHIESPPVDVIGREVLINMAVSVPAFFAEFQRVVEVVDQNPQTLQESRQRFRVYREHGCTPNAHQL